jgi:dolichol-phosphate mannosyltransferase
MARVSLILPTTPKVPLSPGRATSFQRSLEEAGHEVEVVVVTARGTGIAEGTDASWRWVETNEPGLAAAAIAGLREAEGEVLVVLDPAMGYAPGDVSRVVEPLARGEADLAVASRFVSGKGWVPKLGRGPVRTLAGLVARPLTGTTDPLSGLVGLTRSLFFESAHSLRPVGTKFAVELLARADARWVEVPAQADWPPARRGVSVEYDDLRQIKRLADHRFGNYSRLIQFCVVGASGMVVDLSCYAFFQLVFGRTALATQVTPIMGGSLALTLSAFLAVAIALTWNFSLNRRLTFSYARRGSILRQFITYAISNAIGIIVSLALRLTLPRYFAFFNAHKLAAAVVGIVTATGISFSMSRWVVFRPRTPADGPEPRSGRLDPPRPGPLGSQQSPVGAFDQGASGLLGSELGQAEPGAQGPESRLHDPLAQATAQPL